MRIRTKLQLNATIGAVAAAYMVGVELSFYVDEIRALIPVIPVP